MMDRQNVGEGSDIDIFPDSLLADAFRRYVSPAAKAAVACS